MKSLAKKLFLIACTFVIIILCSNLKSQRILVEGAVSNGWQYSIMQVADGTSYAYDVKPATTLSGSVTIPSTLGGAKVQALADGAFKDNTGISSLYVPSSLTTIGSSAFSGCSKLTNIDCSQTLRGAKFTTIGDNAFYNCSSLRSMNLSETTDIGRAAFLSCSSLENIDLSNATIIGQSAFSKCNSLTEVTFGKEGVEIGIGAFSGCTKIKSVTFQSENVSIPSQCFWSCSALQDIHYSEQVNSIKIAPAAFDSCTALRELHFPVSVEIVNDAFRSCKNINKLVFDEDATISGGSPGGAFAGAMCVAGGSIHCKGNLTITTSYAFADCTGLKTLICEKNMVIKGMWNFGGCSNLTTITVNGNFTNEGSQTFDAANQPMTLTFGDEVSGFGPSNVKTAIYKGNTKQLISASAMIFEDTVTSVSGSIDGSVAEEVVFYNPSINLDNITLAGEQKKIKFYGLKGSTAETFSETHKDNSYFFDLVLSDWNFHVTVDHNTFDWKDGEAMPNLTPETLGLTVQATYYREDSARTIPYSPEDPLKGYQLEIPALKEGENTISVKYSGWNKPLTIIIQKQEMVVPATATPSTTPTVPAKQTESPTPTDQVKQTESPTPTTPMKQTASPTPTAPVKQTESPTSTAPVKQTASPRPTAPAKQTASPRPTVPAKQTESPTPTYQVEQTESPAPTDPVTQTASPTPTALMTKKPSLASTVLENQNASPMPTAPVVSASPEVTAEPKVLHKNKTYLVKNIKYKVLSIKGKKGTASIVGYNKAASSLQLTNSVKISNYTLKVTRIDAKAFRDCQKLSGKLVIPKYVTSIGDSAFYNCRELTSVTLTKSLTSIGTSAFENCKNLQSVMFKGKNIKKVGKKAFFHNSKMPVRKFNMATKYIPYYQKILMKQKQYN